MAKREEAFPSSASISLAILLLLSLTSGGILGGTVQAQKTWCVAKPSSSNATLWENLNYACSAVDCSILHDGCSCFQPNNLMSHASIAMNLYYQAHGRNTWNCWFKNSALIVTTDPSFGDCTYACA